MDDGEMRARPGAPDLRLASPAGRWLLVAAVLGSALAGIDATVVNVALPAIGRDLDAEFGALQWTITGYTLTLASLILLGGSMGDRFGRRRVFLVGVVWFAVASLACGLAPNAPVLILARAVQGVGAALLTPGSLAMIQASFRRDDRPKAIGVWSAFGGVATAAGPFLGGWLVEAVSWRLVFLINLPLAAAVVLIGLRHVPETRDPDAPRRLDLLGGALSVVALAGVTAAVIAVPDDGIGAAPVLVPASTGVLAAVAFVVRERQARAPMLPLSIFASRQFTATNAVTFVVYAVFGGVFFLLTLQLQVVVGFTPLAAGLATMPVTVLMLLLSAWSGGLAQRIGARLPMTVGPLLCAASVLLMLRIGPGAGYLTDVLPAVVVLGLGLSVLVAPLTSAVLGAVADEHAGIASGVNNAVARAANLLAVAAFPVIGGLTGAALSDPAAFAAGFTVVLWVGAGLLVVGAVLAWTTVAGHSPAAPDDRGPEPAHVHCPVTGPEVMGRRTPGA
ncbi:MFS transporter [Nakamurella leprariae]|uniref:MFS transporter n=1 Tax=Nakamurella leprariae TaxID=2803911 RepID=A0A938YEQ3_9ACTN|nr:MFS transporter [Nakamurella leprariae]MBM9466398.1 MFS transporter [Nakamurella leprariae]